MPFKKLLKPNGNDFVKRRLIVKNHCQIIGTLICKINIINFSDKNCQIFRKLGNLKLI